jgi:hypothetical protein
MHEPRWMLAGFVSMNLLLGKTPTPAEPVAAENAMSLPSPEVTRQGKERNEQAYEQSLKTDKQAPVTRPSNG